jgi:ribonuclease HI
MTRRKVEPDARALLRFVAEHESLVLTIDEFPELGEERIRALLLTLAEDSSSTPAVVGKAPATKAARATARSSVGSTLQVVLHTDGASRGNPGPAAAGWVISTVSGRVLRRNGAFLGRKTNNEAEYEAVIHGLAEAIELGAEEVALRADSELLIRQLNGAYQVRNENISALHRQARALMGRLRRIDARHVPRAENSAADAMANKAIDAAIRRTP